MIFAANVAFGNIQHIINFVSLYFMPTILQVWIYSLLYYIHEQMMRDSRIEVSQAFINRVKHEKFRRCVRISAAITISILILGQLGAMVLCFFNLIRNSDLYITITATSGFLILALNINTTVVYLNLSSLPYKSQECYQK
jgi:uncharacterized membrane protein YfcA